MKDYDEIDRIVREKMLEMMDIFKNGLGIPFVSHDPKVEKKFIKKMHKAAKRIYNYYSLPEDQIE